jgi:hypothetical protein
MYFGKCYWLRRVVAHQFTSQAGSSLVASIVGNLILDYVGLLKTRLTIAFLLRRPNSVVRGLLAVIGDFAISFMLFQSFYSVFYFVGLVFSFGYGHMVLPAADPYSFYPMVELMLIFAFVTGHAYVGGVTPPLFPHLIQIILVLALVGLSHFGGNVGMRQRPSMQYSDFRKII